ncbi:hypothetical protein, partial [Pseudomonas amygdali]
HMQRSQPETIGLVLNGEALVVRFFPNSVGSPITGIMTKLKSMFLLLRDRKNGRFAAAGCPVQS